jgi:hypothetical protein
VRRSFFFAAALALCASCQSPTESNPFWTVIEVTPATLQLGDTMTVRVTMKNTSISTQRKVGAGLLAPGAYKLTPPEGFRGSSVDISIVE